MSIRRTRTVQYEYSVQYEAITTRVLNWISDDDKKLFAALYNGGRYLCLRPSCLSGKEKLDNDSPFAAAVSVYEILIVLDLPESASILIPYFYLKTPRGGFPDEMHIDRITTYFVVVATAIALPQPLGHQFFFPIKHVTGSSPHAKKEIALSSHPRSLSPRNANPAPTSGDGEFDWGELGGNLGKLYMHGYFAFMGAVSAAIGFQLASTFVVEVLGGSALVGSGVGIVIALAAAGFWIYIDHGYFDAFELNEVMQKVKTFAAQRGIKVHQMSTVMKNQLLQQQPLAKGKHQRVHTA